MVDINDIFMKNNVLPRSTVANPNFINQPQTRTLPYSVFTTPKSRFTALPAKEGSYTLGQTAQNQFANGMQQGGKNMYAKPAFVKPTQTSPTNVPPNQLGQNLLNFTTSPQGRGLARGLLEASGYSTTPVSMGSALAQGMKYIDEANTAQSSAQQQEFENQLAIANLNASALKNQPDQYRPLTLEERKAFGIPKDGAFRFNITKGKPESIGGGGSTTSTTVINEAENKGSEGYFETKGDDFGKSVNLIETTAVSADDDNMLLNRFEQLAKDTNTGALTPFLTELNSFAASLGIDVDLKGLGALEALNSVSGRFVMQQVQKTKGAVSDREMAYFFKISANIGNTALGNQLIINMARSINDRAIAENDLLQNFLSKEYEENPNQSAYSLDQKFKKIRSEWRKENQIFTGDIEEEIKQYYKDNGLTYTGGVSDMNKTDINRTNNLSKFQEKYPNAKYMGETENGKSQFQVNVDGDLQTFEI
jgi:hypothetical protein